MDHPLLDPRGPRLDLSPLSTGPTVRAHPRAIPYEAAPESMLDEYARVFKRRRRLILFCACAGALLSLLFGLVSLPVYTTRTSLDIRSLNNDFINMRSVAPTGDNTSPDNDTNLQTQIKLLQSESLIEQVKNNLLAQPHPRSIPREDLLSRLGRPAHLDRADAIPYEAVVEDASKRTKVKPLGLTRLVEITCSSYDPQFSATYCNTLTNTFEELDRQTRVLEAQKTSEWLTHQVADVRLRSVEAEKKLEQAVGGNGLMLSQTTTSSGEERLRSIQDELTRAQADRIQKEAQSTVALGAPADTLPGVQDNPEHRAYEVKLAELNNQVAQLVPALTEQNTKVVRLRSQIADAEAGLLRTQAASTRRQDNEFSAARHREALLQRAYQAQQASVSSDLQKATKVTLLRKELDSEQQLYQTLLQRAKEAGFASAMQAATIRVVDAAQVPQSASSPRRLLAACLGLLLGSFGGVGLAFFRERNDRVFRAPGDIPRYLNVQELGVIPSAKKIKRSIQPTASLSISGGTLPAESEVITLTRWGDDYSIAAEAYRNATLSILLDDTSQRPRSYVVSSPSAGEGKTTIVSNLGVALSKSRLRVVLIDGDLRRPALHRAFGLDNTTGLRNILRGEVDLQNVRTEALVQRSSLKNISVIPAGNGSEDVVELLHSAYFGALLGRLSRDFDVVLIDTPPITHMADARILARHADGAILVFRAGVTTRDEAADARDRFDRDGVRLVGTLLNDFKPERDGRNGYYSSYTRYQDGSEADRTGAA